MKNCEVVIIVVSVLNSSNFSKKKSRDYLGISRDKKTKLILLPEKRRKNTDGFLAAYLLTLARERCARHLVMPKKTKNNLRKKICKKNLPKFFKQSIFASDLQNKQTNKHAKPCNCTFKEKTPP